MVMNTAEVDGFGLVCFDGLGPGGAKVHNLRILNSHSFYTQLNKLMRRHHRIVNS